MRFVLLFIVYWLIPFAQLSGQTGPQSEHTLPVGLTFDFINDFVSPLPTLGTQLRLPARAIYRRGNDICLEVRWAATANAKDELTIVAAQGALWQDADRSIPLQLRSPSLQQIQPASNRVTRLKVVYGNVPNWVGKGRIQLPLQVFLNGKILWETLECELFLVENRPILPPLVEGVDVLTEATQYARGKAGTEAVTSAMTQGLFGSNRFRYDDRHSVELFDFSNGKNSLAQLAKLTEPLPANCYQVTGYLATLLAAVGIESELREIVLDYKKSQAYAFQTAPLVAIGTDPTRQADYKPQTMFSHQFVLVNQRVYDPVYAVLKDPKQRRWQQAITNWSLVDYLGQPIGLAGFFIRGTPTGKRAYVLVNPGEPPFMASCILPTCSPVQ